MSVKKGWAWLSIRPGYICGGLLLFFCVVLAAGCLSSFSGPGNASLSPSSSMVSVSPVSQASGQCPQETAAGNVTNASEIIFDPTPGHVFGDTITFSGTTNLAAGETLSLKILSTEFTPCAKGTGPSDLVSACSGGYFDTVIIQPGNCGVNTWTWMVDTSQHGFQPNHQYILTASGRSGQVQNSTLFEILNSTEK